MTDTPTIISREEAKAIGQKWYFTGELCRRGHVAKRDVSGCGCRDCKIFRRDSGFAAPKSEKSLLDFRAEAKKMGLVHFFTGVPCVNGHIDKRFAVNGKCKQCVINRNIEIGINKQIWFRLTKLDDGSYIGSHCKICGDDKRDKQKQCPTCKKRRQPANVKAQSARNTAKRKLNPEFYKAKERAYYKKATHIFRAGEANHRALKLQAKPKWLNKQQKKAISLMYKTRQPGYQVDHIVPLNSAVVCGLHVPANLQHLTKTENQNKRNTFPYCQRSMQPAWFDDKN